MIDQRSLFLTKLIAEHGVALERFLARKMNNAQDAAEIAQEAFLRLYRLDDLEQLDDSRAFLYRVASNMAIDQLRRNIVHDKYIQQTTADWEGQASASPEKIVAAKQELQRIYQAVAGLPLKARQVFLLHRKSGLSYSEIATEMGMSVSSVEKYMLQALKHCRSRMV